MSWRRILCLAAPALVVGLLAAASSASAQGEAAPTVWLCKPGQSSNPCTSSQRSTELLASGAKRATKTPKTPKNPPIDCFYVYPTVSQQMTGNSTLEITPAETGVAIAQASRFSSKCRVYAPMYRQTTLAGIFNRSTTPPDRELAYSDIKAAWNEYLSRYNKGRGIVLIGHSQGTGQLIRLTSEEIDPNAKLRKRLVSALLIGGGVLVKQGTDVGGSFQNIPACRKTNQNSCVVAYNTFPSQPPANSLFGRTTRPGLEVLCTNPTALARNAIGRARTYVPTVQFSFDYPNLASTPWVNMDREYRTQCRSGDGANWLQADLTGGADDKRPKFNEPLGPTWGFHIPDLNIPMANLVDLVDRQSVAWRKK